jgi:circadian clock protein KaiC
MSGQSKAQREPRCPLGIEGLDEILGGGLPPNRLYLIQGRPGVGKTTLALQFLLEGARLGESGLYVTLSETQQELEGVAKSHGWELGPIHLFEVSSIAEEIQSETDNTFFHPSEVELNRTIKAVLDEVARVKPVRVVFDSLSELRMLAETALRYRRQILRLKQSFAGQKCTVLLLDEYSAGPGDLQIESVAHGVIWLQCSAPEYGVSRRQLNIQKLRGVKFREGNHDFIIRRGGLVVFPRLVAADHHTEFKRESIPSGNPELDAMLGGGLDRGTSTMLMGPPGTGKSTLTIKFVLAAANRGEKVLFFAFDETLGTLTGRAAQMSMDLGPHLQSGVVRLQQIDPAEISPGELASTIQHGVVRDGIRWVIIDSINGYLNAMPEDRCLNLQLHELLAFLNQRGVLTIMVLAQQGLVGMMQSSVDLTYLADTVLLFRYFESRGSLRQALSVIKKRSGTHERTLREIRVGSLGVQVGQPLADMQGVLTGVPSFHESKENVSAHETFHSR